MRKNTTRQKQQFGMTRRLPLLKRSNISYKELHVFIQKRKSQKVHTYISSIVNENRGESANKRVRPLYGKEK